MLGKQVDLIAANAVALGPTEGVFGYCIEGLKTKCTRFKKKTGNLINLITELI